MFSTDGGTTWTTFTIPNAKSQQQGADPSIAIDADSTIYYSYVNNEPVAAGNPPEGHARVVVGHRVGTTVNWTNYFDLGATHGVVNAAEIEAVGGSSGRAAIGFLGTNVNGGPTTQLVAKGNTSALVWWNTLRSYGMVTWYKQSTSTNYWLPLGVL